MVVVPYLRGIDTINVVAILIVFAKVVPYLRGIDTVSCKFLLCFGEGCTVPKRN